MPVNAALTLAGGTGTRMQMGGVPKQYLMVRGKAIIDYSLSVFQRNELISSIFIGAEPGWRDFLNAHLSREGISKFGGYALPGENRQLSILNGLESISREAPETDNVIIHDAARPLVTDNLITQCLIGLEDAHGVMPSLPIKDTCYLSLDGTSISKFVPRNELFAGQAPEAFRFRPYLSAHESVSVDFLKQVSGSSELAYKCGLDVKMIRGIEQNIKITTKDDLLLFEKYLDCGVG